MCRKDNSSKDIRRTTGLGMRRVHCYSHQNRMDRLNAGITCYTSTSRDVSRLGKWKYQRRALRPASYIRASKVSLCCGGGTACPISNNRSARNYGEGVTEYNPIGWHGPVVIIHGKKWHVNRDSHIAFSLISHTGKKSLLSLANLRLRGANRICCQSNIIFHWMSTVSLFSSCEIIHLIV